MDQGPALARVFGYLSFLTIGGGMAAYPQMKVDVVGIHHWLTNDQLVHVYSTGQMSPGPNMMMVAEIGYLVAGILGATICAVAFFVPTGILTFGVGRAWQKLANWPWRESIQRGLGPVAIGLAVAGLITFGHTAITSWLTALVAVVTFFVVYRTTINPVWLILAGGVVGVIGMR
jgi:chromate transporter